MLHFRPSLLSGPPSCGRIWRFYSFPSLAESAVLGPKGSSHSNMTLLSIKYCRYIRDEGKTVHVVFKRDCATREYFFEGFLKIVTCCTVHALMVLNFFCFLGSDKQIRLKVLACSFQNTNFENPSSNPRWHWKCTKEAPYDSVKYQKPPMTC